MSNLEFRQQKIAVVDDCAQILSSLGELLRSNGYCPAPITGTSEYRSLAGHAPYDLAIIEMHLDGISGLDLVRSIRKRTQLPIIMMAAGARDTDPVVGLEAGADDFLTKPLNTRELIARIRAVLRRYGRLAGNRETMLDRLPPDSTAIGDFQIAMDRRRLYDRNGREISLTNSEFKLLEFFIRNPNRIVQRVDLLRHLGSDCTQYVDRSIDVLILRLRRKIEACPSRPVYLQTRRGKGYIFVHEDSRPNSQYDADTIGLAH